MATITAFDLEERKSYEREMLRRRFESVLKTVAEDNNIDLGFTKEVGASTDGVRAKITDPFTFFDLGFKTSDAISIALHCTIHEASHILYSGIPKLVLGPAYKTYVPLGYKWHDFFWCLDAMEDYRVNHLMEKVRPGITKYRTKASKLMIDMLVGTEDHIVMAKALMRKYFSVSKYTIPEDLEVKFDAACVVFDECNTKATSFAEIIPYAVQLYDILYEKRETGEKEPTKLRKRKKSKPGEKEGKRGTSKGKGKGKGTGTGTGTGEKGEGGSGGSFMEHPEDVPSFMSSGDDEEADEDLTVPEDDEDTDLAFDEELVLEEDEPDEEPKEEVLDLDSKPAMMGDVLDAGIKKLEERAEAIAALEGDSTKFGGTAYMYPVAPINGAKITSKMVAEGLHTHTPVIYVKLPEDKLMKIGSHKKWLVYLNSAPVQNRVRTFIGKAKNVLKLDNKGIVEQRRSGRPIGHKLWRASSDIHDPKVFTKTLDASRGNTAVYILADNSGSMRGIIDVTREAVYMLAKLMIHYNIPCKVVIFDCDMELSRSCVRHVELKDWDEKTADGIARYNCGCDNRDGLSIHLATLELAQRNEHNKILFVLSDGSPCDKTSSSDSYYNEDDVANYVRKARGLGINVLGVYMQSNNAYMSGERMMSEASSHKRMYGDELYTISKLEQIPGLLLRALGRFTT